MKITESHSNSQIISEVARRMQERRIKLNITQKELAKQAGISPRTLTNIEEGQNYSFLTLIALLKSLNLIDSINNLIPETLVEPISLIKASANKKRKRASKTKLNPQGWKWGDES